MTARFGELVFSTISANGGVTAIIGTVPVRLYPGKLPQGGTHPAAVYNVITDQRTYSLAGYTSSTRRARIQLDAYAQTYDVSQDLGDALASAMDALLSSALSSVQVSRRDLYDDEAELHRVSLEFSLWSSDT